jgi:predicted amidophosphoribosyltransferase
MSSPGDVCARCMQPVPKNAARCPRCGTPQGHNPRRTGVLLGMVLVLSMVFVIWLMVKAIHEEDLRKGSPGSTQHAPSAP